MDSAAYFIRELERVLQALALPGAALDALVPAGASVIGELAMETPAAIEGYLRWHGTKLSETQRAQLVAVSDAMDTFVAARDVDLYEYDPATEHPTWLAIHDQAERALASLGWPCDPTRARD